MRVSSFRGLPKYFVISISLLVYLAAIILIYRSSSESGLKRDMQIFHILIIFQVMLTTMSLYLWKQLVTKISKTSHKTQHKEDHSVAINIWKITVFIFLFLAHISLGIGRIFPAQTTPNTFVFLSYCCLGIYAILLGVLIPLDLVEFLLRVALSQKIQWPCRKGFKVFVVLFVSITLGLHGIYTASKGPAVKSVHIPVHKLPNAFHGMTVVQLTDIHLGPTVGRRQMWNVVSQVNQLKPDMVVITGDLVESSVESLAGVVEPVRGIHTKYGTFFSTGNHEYHTGDVNKWFDHLEFLGVECLHNSNVQIKHQNNSDWFYLAGTDDWHAYMFGSDHGFDLHKAMLDTDKDHAVILMAHQPNAAKAALDSEYDISLILSGHTHGGQFFPLNIFTYLVNPFYAGLYHVTDHAYVYVSSGTFYYGPPIRMFSTSEITHITLLAH